MSDIPRSSPRRGLRIGVVSVLVAVAFLIGLALAVVLVRRQTQGDALTARSAVGQPAASTAGITPVSPAPAATAAPVLVDPGALAARETALAGQIAALEARTDALAGSAQMAGGQAARAEALLVVVAARRALDKGVGLGPLDTQLQARLAAAQPRAVATVHDVASRPVTLETLRQGLEGLGPVLTTGAGRGWWDAMRHGLRTLVVVRHAGTPSPLPIDRLARASRLLDQGQVEAAVAEVRQLPGAGAAANWDAEASRYVAARQSLDQLENAALAGQARPAPDPAPSLAPLTPAG